MTLIQYRPLIDGLRAVALLLVIFHHLGDWGGTRGGYVGVDVFFVISGYLITSIVKRELEAGRFTFGDFYRRRIIRLAPAYFTVLLATTIAALAWMLPGELLAYARSMAASSMFLANVHMWKAVGAYFGMDAYTVPLLHLWSLGVEEQFYLFWPFTLLFAHRLAPRSWLPWLVVTVALGGTVVSQWGVVRFPAAAYYLLPTRVFELAVGAMLAYLPLRTERPAVASVLSFAGLILIAYAAFGYGKETPFPGYAAMMPVVGTALLLFWGDGTVVGRVLSTPVMTLIGKLSYPGYLWHWPIIAFLYINEIALTVWVGMTVVAVTLCLAWLTHRFIELPARRFLTLPARQVVAAGAGLPIALAMMAAILLIQYKGLPGRFPGSLNIMDNALHASPSEARGACHSGAPERPAPAESCRLGRQDGPIDFLLIGDSHANHFSGFLDVLGRDAGMRGYDITRNNTPYFPGVELRIPQELEYGRNFTPRNEYISQLLARSRYDTVVLAGAYESLFNQGSIYINGMKSDHAFRTGFGSALRQASAAASHVIVLTTIPQLQGNLHNCGLRAARFGRDLDCTFPSSEHFENTAHLREVLASLKGEFPNVIWIDVDQLLCNNKRCLTEIDGIPLYKDSGHLNDVGSRLLAGKWIARYGNPLKANTRHPLESE